MSVYLVFTTFFVLIPMVGLAIDVSVMYNVKAKLQTAVDAAAIGAGVTLQRTTDVTDPTQITAIKNSAQKFFTANYPVGYWKSSQIYYDSVPSKDVTGAMTIWVHAEESVPLLFLRVVGISRGTVAAQATAKIRYVTLMIAVDRSGSVWRAGNNTVIESTLKTYINYAPTDTPAGQSVFVDGRDYIGLVSFGGNYNLDYAPSINFKTGATKLVNAISNMDAEFNTNNSTNTGEGLYQAYYQLKKLNQTGALNVIILLTDGQPTAFSGEFVPDKGTCVGTGDKLGWISTPAQSPFPTSGTTSGVFQPYYGGANGDQTVVNLSATSPCTFNKKTGGAPNGSPDSMAASDISTFPATAGPIQTPDGLCCTAANRTFSTTGQGYPIYVGGGNSTANPKNIRWAAYNVADNIAAAIRKDTTLNPLIYVIGLNEPPGEEPLNADWLARVANDPNYRAVGTDGNYTPGQSVLQSNQTQGAYYNVTSATLGQAFQQIAAQILRLSQ